MKICYKVVLCYYCILVTNVHTPKYSSSLAVRADILLTNETRLT